MPPLLNEPPRSSSSSSSSNNSSKHRRLRVANHRWQAMPIRPLQPSPTLMACHAACRSVTSYQHWHLGAAAAAPPMSCGASIPMAPRLSTSLRSILPNRLVLGPLSSPTTRLLPLPLMRSWLPPRHRNPTLLQPPLPLVWMSLLLLQPPLPLVWMRLLLFLSLYQLLSLLLRLTLYQLPRLLLFLSLHQLPRLLLLLSLHQLLNLLLFLRLYQLLNLLLLLSLYQPLSLLLLLSLYQLLLRLP